jgi:predicted transcriptional regulator
MITVVFNKKYDAIKKEFSEDTVLQLQMTAFRNGLVSKLKPTNFAVFLAICSFMDEKGECYPTQRQIADICGISKTTVNKAINELLEFEIDGKPLISRKLIKNGSTTYSVYTVNAVEIEGEAIDDKTEETAEDTLFKNNCREVALYFAKVYRETYGVNYSINYKRDLSLIKTKLIGTYTDEQLKKMIDVAVKEYDKRWKKPDFPRPTIPMLVSWLGQQALGVAMEEEKEFEEIQEMTSDSVEKNELAMNRLMKRLQK